jgi:hypothetical protein
MQRKECIYSHQNVGQNNSPKTDNRLFENVTKLKYLGTTPANQNRIPEEVKNREHILLTVP